MKTVFLPILMAIMTSCSTNPVSERDELLTSIRWTVDSQSKETLDMKEACRFSKDGTFTLEAHDTRVIGKWSWISSNEIYLEEQEIVISGKAYKFDSAINYYIRVIEISDKVFRTIERHEGNSWDSGFAKEIKYIP
ncbi:MAG: hypothetical protein ABI663_01570 [Chryseolinea sp.]